MAEWRKRRENYSFSLKAKGSGLQEKAEMKSEESIRQMLAILWAFNQYGKHDLEITALSWVLGEYPVRDEKEAAEAIAPGNAAKEKAE